MRAFQYGWEKKESGSDTFWVRFNACTREPKTWKEEVYAAARSITARSKKPIWICSSGGIDSEVACRAFYDQGIRFSVLTVVHAQNTNQHDVKFAIKWCKDRGVTHEIYTLDMPSFLSSEVDAYAKRFVAIHPFRFFQIKLMEIVESMGGYAVLAGGEQLFLVDRTKPLITREDVFLMFTTGNAAPLEWCRDTATSHEPYFYFSTPELCLSYVRLPLVSFALENPELVFRHKSNAYTFKRLVYQSIWTDIDVRYKSDGFEKISPIVEASKARLEERFKEQFSVVKIPVNEFEKQLNGTLSKSGISSS